MINKAHASHSSSSRITKRSSSLSSPTRSGFTIVELLIVIVVIAILAAISIIAYRGIQDRANSSSASAKAAQIARQVQVYYAQNDTYPDSLSQAGVTDTSGLQYKVNNTTTPKTYCLTATTSNKSYYISNTTTSPTEGGCSGHGVGGIVAITNLVANPSLRTSVVNWRPSGAVTRVADAQAVSGYAAEKESSQHQLFALTVELPAGTTQAVFGIDLWLPADEVVASKNIKLWAEHYTNPYTNWLWQDITITKTKQRFYGVITVPAGQNIANFGIREASGHRVRASAAFVAAGTTTPLPYYDGDSPNWDWNGTPNNSTSSGPAS